MQTAAVIYGEGLLAFQIPRSGYRTHSCAMGNAPSFFWAVMTNAAPSAVHASVKPSEKVISGNPNAVVCPFIGIDLAPPKPLQRTYSHDSPDYAVFPRERPDFGRTRRPCPGEGGRSSACPVVRHDNYIRLAGSVFLFRYRVFFHVPPYILVREARSPQARPPPSAPRLRGLSPPPRAWSFPQASGACPPARRAFRPPRTGFSAWLRRTS